MSLETSRQVNVTCPHCGYVNFDSWEYKEDWYDSVECPDCDELFSLERVVDVSYTTQKIIKREVVV